jgi:hypothetical protein
MRSDTRFLLCGTAGEKVGEQGLANVWSAVTAILDEEEHDLSKTFEVCVIDYGAAMAVASNKSCP